MVRCPVCGASVRGVRERDGFLRCPICRAKLRVTTSRGSIVLYYLAFMIVATFMITTGFFIFIYLPVLAAIIGIRSQLGKAEAVPEWASSRQTSGTENEPTRPSATSRRDAAPVINGSSQRVAPTGRYCIYCGAMISDSNWRFCGNCGASIAAPDSNQRFREINAPEENDSIGKCMVCGLAIRKSEPVAYCIYCGNVAHRLHLLEWVHVKGICPMCEEHLTEKDI